MKNKIIIKKAAIAAPTGKLDSTYVVTSTGFKRKKVVEYNVIKVINCVVVEEDNIIIDVETHEIFPIVTRGEAGIVLNDNAPVTVALHIFEPRFDKMDSIELFILNGMAKSAYKSYLKTKKEQLQPKNQHVKKKSK